MRKMFLLNTNRQLFICAQFDVIVDLYNSTQESVIKLHTLALNLYFIILFTKCSTEKFMKNMMYSWGLEHLVNYFIFFKRSTYYKKNLFVALQMLSWWVLFWM